MDSYDQWGIDLEKKLADAILLELRVPGDVSLHDSSTDGLPIRIKLRQRAAARSAADPHA